MRPTEWSCHRCTLIHGNHRLHGCRNPKCKTARLSAPPAAADRQPHHGSYTDRGRYPTYDEYAAKQRKKEKQQRSRARFTQRKRRKDEDSFDDKWGDWTGKTWEKPADRKEGGKANCSETTRKIKELAKNEPPQSRAALQSLLNAYQVDGQCDEALSQTLTEIADCYSSFAHRDKVLEYKRLLAQLSLDEHNRTLKKANDDYHGTYKQIQEMDNQQQQVKQRMINKIEQLNRETHKLQSGPSPPPPKPQKDLTVHRCRTNSHNIVEGISPIKPKGFPHEPAQVPHGDTTQDWPATRVSHRRRSSRYRTQ